MGVDEGEEEEEEEEEEERRRFEEGVDGGGFGGWGVGDVMVRRWEDGRGMRGFRIGVEDGYVRIRRREKLKMGLVFAGRGLILNIGEEEDCQTL